MDEVVRKVAALGLPGVISVLLISGVSLTVGPPSVVMLAALGGPVGFLGGGVAFGLTALITDTVARYGIEAVLVNIYRFRARRGEDTPVLIREIDGLPITKQLKATIKTQL